MSSKRTEDEEETASDEKERKSKARSETDPEESSDNNNDQSNDVEDSDPEEETSSQEDRVVRGICAATTSKVLRTDYNTGEQFWEQLDCSSGGIILDSLNSGSAPCLNNHRNEEINDVLGVVERAIINEESQELLVDIRFSRRPEVDHILNDIRDKIIRNVSVGYEIQDSMILPPGEDGLPIKLVTKWMPREVSVVGIPADTSSGIRKNNKQENHVLLEPATSKNSRPDTTEQNNLIEQEISRGMEIRKAVRAAKLSEAFADDLVLRRINLDQARKEILDEFSKESSQPEQKQFTSVITPGTLDEKTTQTRALSGALLHRMNPKLFSLPEESRKFVGITLQGVAMETEKRSLPSYNNGQYRWVERAFTSTSDFPIVLENVLNKSLRAYFENAPVTYPAFTKTVSVPDFRNIHRVQIGETPLLEPVNENGEFRRASLKESKQTYKVSTFGQIIGISREMLVNDSMQAFEAIPRLMGNAAQELISHTVYKTLTSDTALMSDGNPLFHADHRNLGTASAIDIDALSEGRTAMRLQRGYEERVLGLNPSILLVPANAETKAQQFITKDYLAGVISGVVEERINPFAGTLKLICEPRLDDMTQGAWYLICDPGVLDTMEIAYLDGQSGPFVDYREGFSTSGIEYKIRLDFGVGVIEHRAFFKNPGPKADPKKK